MYVDGYHSRDKDVVYFVERDAKGKRQYNQFPAKYLFYYQDANGSFTSIYGEKLSRIQTTNGKEFAREKKRMSGRKLYESDCNVVFRTIADHYLDQDAPKLNVAFFDIEVDFDKDKGFAPPEDPFNSLTAVGIHLAWFDKTVCFALKPKGMSQEEAESIANKFDNTFIMESEEELLLSFLELVDDADILSGWNSEGFDIPYMVNRIALVLGKDYTRKFCLWDQFPKKRKFERYGKENVTFDLTGRVHFDYMALYKNYTYHEMHSYSLDAIAEHELGEKKIDYEGTLDQLYNNDFEKFLAYNIQDTELLRKLDDKLQFIDLANTLAHANGVLLQTTMGAVAQTDQAIINDAHRQGLIVPDKERGDNPFPAAGAYVATPVKGKHEWIGSMDLNSLYPSILRALNMSPECIVGQVRHTITTPGIEESIRLHKASPVAKYWEGRFAAAEYELVMSQDRETTLILDLEDGNSYEASGAEIYDLIFEQNKPWMITSNGTIFSYEKKGVIPGLLERWYAERKELQAKAKLFKEEGNKKEFDYWDKRQLVRKINLNSLYGALLNPHSRFFDHRLGQSTTLTGRCIARHMASAVNEALTGEYNHIGDSIIYGDTDSVDGTSVIHTTNGKMTIEELFKSGDLFWTDGDKEYSNNANIRVGHVDSELDHHFTEYRYVYRHMVSKPRYRITTQNGKSVIVTDDHSIMVLNDQDQLVEKKPRDLTENDIVITVSYKN